MKIGISVNPYGNGYGRYGEEKFFKIKQHGYYAVDYNLADTNTGLYFLSENEVKSIIKNEKSLIQRAGIQISQIHGPWRYPPQDNTEMNRKERLDKMKRAVIISSLFECKYLVIHPIMPFGTHDLEIGKSEKTWDLNIEFFKDLVNFADDYDVTVCLENMPMSQFSIATPEKVLEIVKTINKDNFKICLDTGHVAVFPELSVGNEVRRLGNYLKVMHIHDNMGDRDSHMYPTKGVIDWADFLDAVDEVGYNNVLSLETSPPGELTDDDFDKEGINLYKIFNELVFEHKKKNF